jgi:AraC-like DNA-binding protein
METLVRAAVLTNFFEITNDLGYDPSAALRRVGLNKSLLKNQDQKIPAKAAVELLETVAVNASCLNLGLRMAQTRQISNFGAVSLYITHQATLSDVLNATISYGYLINEALAMRLETAGKVVILRMEILTESPARQATELALGVMHRMCTTLLGEHWRPYSFNFCHDAPTDLSVHRRLFNCPLEFKSDFNGIVFSAKELKTPNPLADTQMSNYAKDLIESLPKKELPGIVSEVRKAIFLTLPTGYATSQFVAQSLGLHVRTLQRQLQDCQSDFSALLNAVRRELAMRYIAYNHYNLTRLSEQLGYSSPSAFTRWFSDQFGMSPSKWRHSLTIDATERDSH